MKKITHSDSCAIANVLARVKVSVTFRGTHTGSFRVEVNGNPVQPNADGTVTVGTAATLKGASVRIVTVVHQIGPTKFFELDYVIQGTLCGPFTVQDVFDDDDPDVTVRETIRFKASDD
jgi:hypothetical protein